MKILVNISSISQPLTGIGNYSLNLVRELIKVPEVVDIQGFGFAAWFSRADMLSRFDSLEDSQEPAAREVAGATHFNGINHRLRGIARKIPGARSLKRRVIAKQLASQKSRIADYLYWEPNYLLYPYDGVSIATIHDLSHIHFPQYHPQERVQALRRHLPKSIESSRQIVTVSEFTKAEILSCFSVSESKISVVRPAVSDQFRTEKTDRQKRQVRAKYSLPDQFILSVATMEPRKNLAGLIAAFESLPAGLQKTYPLVFVGAKGWLSEAVDRRVTSLERAGLAYRLGYVACQDIAILYAAATVLAYPSFYEGFGMPVAEAMAAGTAVITSGVSSMPEVAQGAAELVDPYDEISIRNALARLLEDANYRQSLERQGRRVSESYTWPHSCQDLLRAFANAH